MISELEFPFDGKEVYLKRKNIKKKLLNSNDSAIPKRIAVLGGATTNTFVELLDIFLLQHGISAVFYESLFGRYYEEAVFPNEALDRFEPDVIYICTSNRNIQTYPRINDSEETINALLDNEVTKFKNIWSALHTKYNCPIIQNNFEMPLIRLLGNSDAMDIHGATNYVLRLNKQFCQEIENRKDLYLCDINYLSSDYGLSRWSDLFFWYMYKYAVHPHALPYLASNVAAIIKALYGKNKKGFVLDLDNTLWGGAIGDVGQEGIQIGAGDPSGEAFFDFQSYIKAHKNLGIILNIASKNDLSNAELGLEHPQCVLHKEDFVVIKANWESKDVNLRDIGKTLDVLPESLVFVDDNPAERHAVKMSFTDVSAPEIGEVFDYMYRLDRNFYFETVSLTDEDKKRVEMYRANMERIELEKKAPDYGEFLKSLNMKADIRKANGQDIERITQLINKSNQFNLTTRRYTAEEVKAFAEDENHIVLCATLSDRFGDNGLVSVVLGRLVAGALHIDLWVMSCRVLKRMLEYAVMHFLAHMAKNKGIDTIYGYYFPTKKNHMVKDFYLEQGFEKMSEDERGNATFRLDIHDKMPSAVEYIYVEGGYEP